MYRFLLTARWLGFAVFVLVVAAGAIRLGLWQWHKWEDRGDTNAHVRELAKRDAIAVGDAKEQWTRVEATGRYLTDDELTVKFAVRASQPGVEVLTPLALSDGTAVLVNRGWLASENTGQQPDDIPAPPAGEVTVAGYWQPDSHAGPEATRPHDGQIRAISSAALADELDLDLVDGYLALSEEPDPPGELVLADPPDLGSGPHFWYALQWWFFAGLAIVGYFWFARAEARPQAKATRSA